MNNDLNTTNINEINITQANFEDIIESSQQVKPLIPTISIPNLNIYYFKRLHIENF